MKVRCLTTVEVFGDNKDDPKILEKIAEFKKPCLTVLTIGFGSRERIEISPRVGHKETLYTFFFIFHRDGKDQCVIKLKPGSIFIKNVDWTQDFIDLEFPDFPDVEENTMNKFRSEIILKIKSMHICCIKNALRKKQNQEEKNNFGNNSNAPETHLNEMNSDLQRNDNKKPLHQTMRDICDAIKHFCYIPQNQTINKLPENVRFMSNVPMRTNQHVSISTQAHFHQYRRKNNKHEWRYLRIQSVTMDKFENLWFDAVNLHMLTITDVKIVDGPSDGDWISFANGIEKMKFLKSLQIFSTFDEFPQIVFDILPISLNVLYLTNMANLTYIPESIYRLKNLQTFGLYNNVNLIELPWENLPKSISYLNLNNTGILRIPEDIQHFCSLTVLSLTKTNLISIPWAFLNPDTTRLEISMVENLTSFKHYTFLKLKALRISHTTLNYIEPTIFPKNLKTLLLDNSIIEEFDFNPDFEFLTTLNLSNNKLKSFPWQDINRPMELLNLSQNELEVLGAPDCWIKIKRLILKNNYISNIRIDNICDKIYNNDLSLMQLNLSHNKLSALPHGFENITQIGDLNISNNLFTFENLQKMNEMLWNRLPRYISKIDVSNNTLVMLPCSLSNVPSLLDITAVGCELRYICPKITQCLLADGTFYFDVEKNSNLKTLSFAPVKTLAYPKKQIKQTVTKIINIPRHYTDYLSTTMFTSSSFISTQRTAEKNVVLQFKPAKMFENEEFYCSCCARCGLNTADPIVEQIMTMDFDLYVETNKELIYNYWKAGEWKTKLVVRFCGDCIAYYRKGAKELNLKRKQAIAEESGKKQNSKDSNNDTDNQLNGECHVEYTEPFGSSSKAVTTDKTMEFNNMNFDIIAEKNSSIQNTSNLQQQFSGLPNINQAFENIFNRLAADLSDPTISCPIITNKSNISATISQQPYTTNITPTQFFTIPVEALKQIPFVPVHPTVQDTLLNSETEQYDLMHPRLVANQQPLSSDLMPSHHSEEFIFPLHSDHSNYDTSFHQELEQNTSNLYLNNITVQQTNISEAVNNYEEFKLHEL